MNLSQTPEFLSFLSTYIMEVDSDADEKSIKAFLETANADRQEKVVKQAKSLLTATSFPTGEFGTEANRWFASDEEAKEWLSGILNFLESGAANSSGNDDVVKDSNGAILQEGDSVTVIKDLKVKGGSSDLKRGTMIKKIHLIGDPENIECRVDGSTLVLKTCFLKKA